jgi:STE24 endopeptidase
VPRPGPIYTFFRASHPSLGDRVDFANRYRPWETGRPMRYARFFH